MGNNKICTANFHLSPFIEHNLFLIEENESSWTVVDKWEQEIYPYHFDYEQQASHRYTTEREAWEKFVALFKTYSKLYKNSEEMFLIPTLYIQRRLIKVYGSLYPI